jgi:dTDP-4-amino-4,6-dideoxygalactose transaminase
MSGTRERLHARTPNYDVTMLGWNYRLDEFRAVVGLLRLNSLHRWKERRWDPMRLPGCARGRLPGGPHAVRQQPRSFLRMNALAVALSS